DQHECASDAIVDVGIERNLIHRLEMTKADLVEVETRSSLTGETIDIGSVYDLVDRYRRLIRLGTQDIGTAGMQRLLTEPDYIGGEAISHFGPGFRPYQHVAARNLDLVLQHQCDGLPLGSARQVTVIGDNPFYAGGLA